MSTELHYLGKRLEKLAEACGTLKKNEEPAVDTSKMSPYEKQQYQVAVIMQRVRANILELDNLGDKAPTVKKSELAQAIRRDIEKMKSETATAKQIAKDHGKKDAYDELLKHVKKTESLYMNRFRAADDAAASALVNQKTSRISELDTEMSQLGRPMVNLREDAEFQQFFDQVQKNDQEMDRALDRISANVQILHNHAVGFSETLKEQNQLLDEAHAKTEKVDAKLKGVNKRLKETIRSVEKDKLCIYVICCILLLALGGAIYWQVTANKK